MHLQGALLVTQKSLSWTVILVAEVKWSILGMCAAVKSLPQSAA